MIIKINDRFFVINNKSIDEAIENSDLDKVDNFIINKLPDLLGTNERCIDCGEILTQEQIKKGWIMYCVDCVHKENDITLQDPTKT